MDNKQKRFIDKHYFDWLTAEKGVSFQGTWPTLVDLFERAARNNPDRMCFECFDPDHQRYTFTQARSMILKVATRLKELGCKKGDIVCVSGKNSPEWAFAYFGILYAGCTVSPIDCGLAVKDLSNLIRFANIKVAFLDADRIKGLKEINELPKSTVCLNPKGPAAYIYDWANEAKAVRNQPEKVSENDVAAVLFTSGTTGTPKGVELLERNLASDVLIVYRYMHIYSEDIFYAILPLHHAYTMTAVLLCSVSAGAGLVFGKVLVPRVIFQDLRRGKVTMFLSVPLLYNKLIDSVMKEVKAKGFFLRHAFKQLMWFSEAVKRTFRVNPGKKLFGFVLDKIAFSNLRICICGGGPLPQETFKLFNAMGVDFVQGYGLTETSPIIALNPVYAYKTASVGKMLEGVEVRLSDCDSDGNGIIHVRGPMIMKGYFKSPEATSEVLTQDGWLNTGDIGRVDKNGYLYLSGRKKNIIVTPGGKNVYPEEIEAEFDTYQDLSQVLIVPYVVGDGSRAEEIMIVARPSDALIKSQGGDKEKVEAKVGEIVGEVNRSLQGYKKITRIRVIYTDMPMTSTKKIKRAEVMKMLD